MLSTALSLSGCATYADLPLGNGRGAASLAALKAPTADMPAPIQPAHRFDPSDGLDATEVAMLAVANSPALHLTSNRAAASTDQYAPCDSMAGISKATRRPRPFVPDSA